MIISRSLLSVDKTSLLEKRIETGEQSSTKVPTSSNGSGYFVLNRIKFSEESDSLFSVAVVYLLLFWFTSGPPRSSQIVYFKVDNSVTQILRF